MPLAGWLALALRSPLLPIADMDTEEAAMNTKIVPESNTKAVREPRSKTHALIRRSAHRAGVVRPVGRALEAQTGLDEGAQVRGASTRPAPLPAGEVDHRGVDHAAAAPDRKADGNREPGQAPPASTSNSRLDELAVSINHTHGIIQNALRSSLRHAIRVGHLLIEAKQEVGHGAFTTWIKANCNFSLETARIYKRLAENEAFLSKLDGAKQQSLTVMTMTGALSRLAKPGSGRAARQARPLVPSGSRPASGLAGVPGERSGHLPARLVGGDRADEAAGAVDGLRPTPHAVLPLDIVDPTIPAGNDHSLRSDWGPQPDPGVTPMEHIGRDDGDGPMWRDVGTDRELPDAAWLDAIPIRKQLANPAIFDEQARIWRSLRPVMESLLAAYRPTNEDVRGAGVMRWVKERYSYRVAFLTGVNPPDEWTACERCQGSGVSPADRMPCDWCKGGGFEVTDGTDRRFAGG